MPITPSGGGRVWDPDREQHAYSANGWSAVR